MEWQLIAHNLVKVVRKPPIRRERAVRRSAVSVRLRTDVDTFMMAV